MMSIKNIRQMTEAYEGLSTEDEIKDFFLSSEVQAVFQHNMQALYTKITGDRSRMKVVIDYNPESKHVAYTDYNIIYINAGDSFVRKDPAMTLVYCLGLLAHEMGHVFWTNRSLERRLNSGLMSTRWNFGDRKVKKYPWCSADWDKYLEEIKDFLKVCPLNREQFISCFYGFSNIIEDGFIEEQFMATFYGVILGDLYYLRDYQYAEASHVEDMLSKKNNPRFSPVRMFESLALAFCKYGEIKRRTDDSLKDPLVKPFVDRLKGFADTVAEKNSFSRYDKSLSLFIDCWPIYKDYMGLISKEEIEKIQKAIKEAGNSCGDGNDANGKAHGELGAGGGAESPTEQSVNRQITLISINDLFNEEDEKPEMKGGQSGKPQDNNQHQGNGQSGNQQSGQQGQDGQSGNQQSGQQGQDGQSGNQQSGQQGQDGQSGNQQNGQQGQDGQSGNQQSGQQGQDGQSGNQQSGLQGQDGQSGNQQSGQQGQDGQSGNQQSGQQGQDGQSGNQQNGQQGQDGQSGNQQNGQLGQGGQLGNQQSHSQMGQGNQSENQQRGTQQDNAQQNQGQLGDQNGEALSKKAGTPTENIGEGNPEKTGHVDEKSRKEILETLKDIKSQIEEEKEEIQAEAIQKHESTIKSLVKAVAEAAELNRQVNEQDKENKSLAQACTSGNTNHRNVRFTVKRYSVEEDTKTAYEQLCESKSLKRKALVATRLLKNKLEQRKNQLVSKSLRMGQRVNIRSYMQDKTKPFERKNLPYNQDLAIGLLLDESGSMSGVKAEATRDTAIFIYELCEQLDIPILVCGHTDDHSSNTTIFQYTDWKDPKKEDRYRLVNIGAHSCNRDGAALLYTLAKLRQRPETKRILMIVSDGMPNSNGYGGETAKKDLQSIVAQAEKEDILVLAAAIDECKKDIEDIYGSERFLDVTDLEELPKIFAKKILSQLNL